MSKVITDAVDIERELKSMVERTERWRTVAYIFIAVLSGFAGGLLISVFLT